ncbi:MAG TPA: biotin--[acetyl-CoA-carboxylase] ligase [Syntrophorhabdales bacterium]|nr:biotin--[acetyl-CoA-carboxylase] ligase [Syntrophorhabdales bacterium]
MNRIGEILCFLREKEEHVSGDYISSRLGLTRTAVWKYVKQLRQMGYAIDTLKGKGYSLRTVPDRPYPWEVKRYLDAESMGGTIHYQESIDSTNALAFQLALADAAEGTCVVAETQKAGKGRLQRKWFSPYGKNLYLSVILRPHLHPSLVYPITFLSSLAVYDTLRELGLKPTLKWPNDVLVNGKKICGTLLELSTEADLVRFVIVGIGLNVNMRKDEMPDEIRSKATSLLLETKIVYERARVCGMLLNNLETYYDLLKSHGPVKLVRTWEEKAEIKGKSLEITQQGMVFKGVVEGIGDEGALLLSDHGKVHRVIAGDVSF